MPIDRELASDLGVALARNEIFVVFQPQIDLETGDIVGAEALCRWRHPRHGLVAPDLFIPLAEETGAIIEIGRYVLDQGLLAVDAWHESGPTIEVSVNVSPVELATDDFVHHLAAQIAGRVIAPGALTIEITESRPLIELEEIIARVEKVRLLGIGVALDDFGTGYATTRHLERLPLTEVKLDRTLIQSPSTESGVVGDLKLAKRRNVRIVGEGIESPSHLARARSLMCDRAQGFLWGRPVPRASFDALLAS